MAHTDKIRDTESHFKIDPSTRSIAVESASNNILVQHDHNSERFTFDVPRYVDGHDMSESTSVRIHYRNASSGNLEKTDGVYFPDDVAVSEDDENTVTFSWLLSAATTQYLGYLHFSVQFVCLDGEMVEYAWNTGVYKDVTIIESINNTEEAAIDIVDAIDGIKAEVTREIEEDLADTLTEVDNAVSNCEDVAAALIRAKENGEFNGEPGADGTVAFDDLTDEQKESLRGDSGVQ